MQLKYYFLLLLLVACAPRMIIPPQHIGAVPPQTISFDIAVSDITDLGGFQTDINYDQKQLSFDHAILGDWFNADNTALFFPQLINSSTPGTIKNLVGVRQNSLKGTGKILTVYFTVLQPGNPTISLTNTLLSNGQGQSLPTTNIKTSTITNFTSTDTGFANKTLLVTTGIQNTSNLYLDTPQEFLATPKATVGSDGPITITYIPKAYTGPVNIYLFSDQPDITFSDLAWYHPQNISHQTTFTCNSPAWYTLTNNTFTCFFNDTMGSNSAIGLPSKDPKNDKIITKILFSHQYDTLDPKTNTFTYTITEAQTWELLNTTLTKTPSTLQTMKYSYVYKGFPVTSGQQYEFQTMMHIPFAPSRSGSYYIGIEEQNNTGITILDPWYNTSWSYRQNLTINSTQVNGTHQNFTLVVHLDINKNLSANALSNGTDIVFVNASGTKLDHEIELYNSTSGQLIAWIRIPTLVNTSDTVISMYYGNPTATDQQNKYGVWDSNYNGVWHLPDTAAVFLNDSTTNGINGTNNNGVISQRGQIDGSAHFDAPSLQYVSMGAPSSLNIGATDFTISYWFNASSASQYGPIVSKRGLAGDVFAQYQTGIGSVQLGTQTAGTTLFFFGYNKVVFQSYYTTNTVIDNNWHYAVFTRTSGTIGITVDGNAMALSTADPVDLNSDDFTNTQNFNLAFQNSDQYFNGNADEVHILTKLARNNSWIITEYNDQVNTTTFINVSPQETLTVTTNTSCTSYSGSGNFIVPCNCTLDTTTNMLQNRIIYNQSGTMRVTSRVYNYSNSLTYNGCSVTFNSTQ